MPSPEELEQNQAEVFDHTAMEKLQADNIKLAEAYSKMLEEYGLSSLGSHPLSSVLQDCLSQVTSGKGDERHGQGKIFLDQPWKWLADTHGVGFLTGQAAKKLEEAQSFEDHHRWEREMKGVIVYAAMAMLYRRDFEEE